MNLTAQILTEQANIARRAETLYAQGYTLEVNNELTSGPVYLMTSPEGNTYAVDPLTKRCNCPYFEKRNAHLKEQPFGEKIFCKHFLGLEQLKEDIAIEQMQVAAGDLWSEEEANREF